MKLMGDLKGPMETHHNVARHSMAHLKILK